MRRFTVILLLLLPFQWAGYLLVFKVQQQQIRHEMKQRIRASLPESQLVLLKIPTEEEREDSPVFQRIHAREFRYRGEMYDIVRQETHADTTWYYCVRDAKESALHASLEEAVKNEFGKDPTQEKPRQQLERLLKALFLQTDKRLIFPHSICENDYFYSFMLKTWRDSPPSPPPKFISV